MSKQTAFKYLILRLVEESFKSSSGNWEEFDRFNNLGKNRLNLICFFVCLANGPESRKKMFEIFNKFYAGELGIYELEIEKILDNTLDDGDFVFGEHMLHIKPITLSKLKNGDAIESVLNIPADQNEAMAAINHSLKVLLKVTRNEFPVFPIDTLVYHSRIHIVWQAYYYPGGKDIIDIEELKTEKSIYAENIADRIFA